MTATYVPPSMAVQVRHLERWRTRDCHVRGDCLATAGAYLRGWSVPKAITRERSVEKRQVEATRFEVQIRCYSGCTPALRTESRCDPESWFHGFSCCA